MAAHKTEVIIYQPVYNTTAKISKANPMFSRLVNSMKLFPIQCYATGSQKSKMAASKDEILTTQHVYNIVS